MNFLKKISYFSFLFIFLLNFNIAQAGLLSNYNDPPGCGGDSFLPNLLICGRSSAAAGQNCQQFTKPCNLGDLVETGGRVLVWVISFALLVVPLFIMYYGAMIIIYRNMDMPGALSNVKKRFWEILIYFIFMLAAWLIVRLVIDIFQVDSRINTFMIDENGNSVKARSFNTN